MRIADGRAAGRKGRLILVTCADIGRLDLVLRAAVRRMPATHALELAEPVVTRSLPAGSGTLVSRSRFGAIDETGDIVLAWQEGDRSFGYTTSVIDHLEDGFSVVAAAPSGCGADLVARSLWPDVVVHIQPGTEKLRSALGSATNKSRTSAPPSPDNIWGGARDVRIHDLGNLQAVVRVLTAELERLCPNPVVHEQRPRPAAAKPTDTLRPGAKSSLATTRNRKSYKRSLDARAHAPSPHARAVSST